MGWKYVENPSEAGNTEPLNSNESSLPVGLVPLVPPPAKVASPTPNGGGIPTPSDSGLSINSGIGLPPSPEGISLHCLRKWQFSLRQLPCKTMLILHMTHPYHHLFASRAVTRIRSHQVSNGKVQSVTHEEVCYTPKEPLEFSNLYK